MATISALTVLFVITMGIKPNNAYLFDRRLTGIEFYPYAQAEDMKIIPSRTSYTVDNARTMLEVLATKFSRVLVTRMDSTSAPRNKGASYYQYANVRAKTAEIAAQINRDRNNLSLSLIIGIWDYWNNIEKLNAEVDIALEATRRAHSIFPGTVEGLFLANYDTEKLLWANETLRMVQFLRNISLPSGVRIGTKQYCEQSIWPTSGRKSATFSELTKEIVKESDFIVCAAVPTIGYKRLDAKNSFESIQSKILRNRNEAKLINPNIDVMLYTFWRKPKNITKVDIENLRDYWYSVDKFASENNYSTYLHGNLDDPRGSSHLAWWKLTRLDLINNVSGYVEKVSGLSADATNKYGNGTEVDNFSNENIVTASIITLVGTVLAGVVYLVYKKRKFPGHVSLSQQDIELFNKGISDKDKPLYDFTANGEAFNLPYDILLEIPLENIEILSDQILGGGQFGSVFRGMLKDKLGNNKEVAIKTVQPDTGSLAVKGLLSEIKLLSYLGYHPNIVPICGACTAGLHKGIVYLATELCSQGSLKQMLNSYRDGERKIDTSASLYNDMIRWSHEIACGMEYLETKRVVHLDLATRNVLLSSENIARITDFGLSRRLHESNIYTKSEDEPLPWRWMAIESLELSEFSTKSDVWGYGVTLWEIFSLGAKPFPFLERTRDFILGLKSGLRLKRPQCATADLFKMMERCWNLDKEERPSFAELKRRTFDMQEYGQLRIQSSNPDVRDQMVQGGGVVPIPDPLI